MDSSSSYSSGLSSQSSSSREPTPEYDPIAAYEARAPLWWDEADWDFAVRSEDDESLTDGEDNFQFLVDGELEEESDDNTFSWGEDISSDEEDEAEDDTSSDEYPPAKRFRAGLEDDDDDDEDEEEAPADGFSSEKTSPAATPMAARTATTTAATAPAPKLGTTRIGLTDDTSSGGVGEVQMPSANLDPVMPKGVIDKVANLAKAPAETQEPITSSSAVPRVSGEGCDLSGLLTFDPESIEPAPSMACDEPRPSAVLHQFQRLKALLSSPIEILVEDPKEVKSVLEEIQHHLPVTLQVKLWPVVTLSVYGSRVKLARQRIDLRHAQLPLKADIADKCQRLGEKGGLRCQNDTSVSTAELETLRKELEDLEERVRATKQLIHDKEALIARSQEEVEGLKAQLKTDLAEIRALNKQLVTGEDEDDEAEIAEVDRVRADALRAFEAFLVEPIHVT
ncbi:hypothetical protein QYE76_038300 [Lolium multiflorum]|uniref:Uncharacterized protein n=1 Tax=Lolium multiflorum TaxID=4521 RepID=A0AAD8T8U5_LOLMU|nr:hypothetical protein QYE76_038300 [Lolium multiflorum]